MRILTKIFISAAVCCILFCGSAAHGASQVHVFNTNLIPTDWNQLLTIPKFNPANGTLVMVTVRVSAHFKAKFDLENLAPNANQVTATETFTLELNPTPIVQWNLDPIMSMFTDNALLAANNGSSDFTGPDTLHVSDSNFATRLREFTSNAELSEFIAMGNSISWDIDTSASAVNSVVAANGPTHAQYENETGLQVKVTYIYNIPEPGSCALLGAGALLTLIRRRPRR